MPEQPQPQPVTADHFTSETAAQTSQLAMQGWIRVGVVVAGILLPFIGYDLVRRPANAPPATVTSEQVKELIDAAGLRAKYDALTARLEALEKAAAPIKLPSPK